MCSGPKVRGRVGTVSARAGAAGRDGAAAHGAPAHCCRTAPLLGALQWRPQGSRGPRDRGPLPPTAHWLLRYM